MSISQSILRIPKIEFQNVYALSVLSLSLIFYEMLSLQNNLKDEKANIFVPYLITNVHEILPRGGGGGGVVKY